MQLSTKAVHEKTMKPGLALFMIVMGSIDYFHIENFVNHRNRFWSKSERFRSYFGKLIDVSKPPFKSHKVVVCFDIIIRISHFQGSKIKVKLKFLSDHL